MLNSKKKIQYFELASDHSITITIAHYQKKTSFNTLPYILKHSRINNGMGFRR